MPTVTLRPGGTDPVLDDNGDPVLDDNDDPVVTTALHAPTVDVESGSTTVILED